MLEAVEFRNFKVLQDTTLPLGRLTLLVGANGSGKSTAMQALRAVVQPEIWQWQQVVTVGLQPIETAVVEVKLCWGEPLEGVTTTTCWGPSSEIRVSHWDFKIGGFQGGPKEEVVKAALAGLRVYNLHPDSIATAAQLQPRMELGQDGGSLAGVLDRLRDSDPERFEALNDELGRWLPEFDRILFDTQPGGYQIGRAHV